MRLWRLIGVVAVLAVLFGTGTWLFAAGHRGALPGTLRAEPRDDEWPVTDARADAIRGDALARAAFRATERAGFTLPPLPSFGNSAGDGHSDDDTLPCRFIADTPSGTSPKFDCILASGDIVKVKYGRNAEVHAEILATRLLQGLGYAADDVTVARRVRCYGCPRYPFFTMRLLSRVGMDDRLSPHGFENAYSEFEWVSVERKFDALAIEADDVKGFAWWELKHSQAPQAEIDAFRLLAVFLAHWDNKSENQRLVCLDARPAAPDQPCARPIGMMQDVGSTFGPSKLNIVRWGSLPIWADRRACTVSMEGFPWGGGTFPAGAIGEEGRLQLAGQLAAIGDADLERMFVDARGPQYLSGTDDRADLAAWTQAFRARVADIQNAGPCPSVGVPADGSSVD